MFPSWLLKLHCPGKTAPKMCIWYKSDFSTVSRRTLNCETIIEALSSNRMTFITMSHQQRWCVQLHRVISSCFVSCFFVWPSLQWLWCIYSHDYLQIILIAKQQLRSASRRLNRNPRKHFSSCCLPHFFCLFVSDLLVRPSMPWLWCAHQIKTIKNKLALVALL